MLFPPVRSYLKVQPITPSKLKRILVVRSDRIGDVILSTPVFSAIKEKYPHCYLAVLVDQSVETLVRGNPFVDEVIAYDKKGKHRSWWRTLWLGIGLRKYHFDLAIHLHPTNRVHILSWLAGIPIRIGYCRKNHYLLTHSIEERKRLGKRHEAEYNFDLLQFIHIPAPHRLKLYVPLHPEDKNELKMLAPDLKDPYVVYHPSASCPSKIWPPERMAELANSLAHECGTFSVIVASGSGVNEANLMEMHLKQSYMNLGGKLSLGMLGWLLKGARLLVSNDSGPVHFASAVGTPVISIFGRNQAGLSPTRWKPLGERSSFVHKNVGCVECLAHDCKLGFKCLQELSVNDVLGEIKKLEIFEQNRK
ncbi:MAG: lipopolysaccharide heptosyltransferase II [Omnitrophica bacterium RIFCSPHIGHO2_02_FULL_45_28]|nr:MAG: lipopolysaccharide heptosyltransferase II [Omnitrophica bacterium RIFCSPHIGHO2_02_FULL_45_28]